MSTTIKSEPLQANGSYQITNANLEKEKLRFPFCDWKAYPGTSFADSSDNATTFFEKSSNTFDGGRRRVAFLDTGDNLVMFFEQQQDPMRLTDAVADLYKSLGVTVDFDRTDLFVTQAEQELIVDTIGRVFSEDTNGRRPSLCDVGRDIEKLTAYFEVAKRAGKLQEKPVKHVSPWNISSFVPSFVPPEVPHIHAVDGVVKRDLACVSSEDNLASSCAGDYWQYPMKTKGRVHILYNNLYSMALVFEDVVKRSCAEELCKEYPEFELIRSVPEPTKDNKDLCSRLFHLKTIDRDELGKKIENFVKLFDLDSPGNDCDMKGNKSELQQVQDVLKTFFVVNDDPNASMRATDVINAITSRVSKASGSFRKRVPGLLLESGLQKKRLKNGNHYYGIRFKDAVDFTAARDSTCLEELEKRRREEVSDC